MIRGLQIFLFMLALGAPLLLQLSTTSEIVNLEMRAPAVLPSLPRTWREVRQCPSAFDAYVNDQFGGRAWLVKVHSRLLYALRHSSSPDVCLGKDGWLFLRRDNGIYEKQRGLLRLSPEQIAGWQSVMIHYQNLLAELDIKLYLVIVPDKHAVYRDKLPVSFKYAGPSMTDQLLPALRSVGIDCLDLRPVLVEERQKSPLQLYHKYDTHWNDQGCLVAYDVLVDTLQLKFPQVSRIAKKDITVHVEQHKGGLSRLLGLTDRLSENVMVAEIANSQVRNRTTTDNYYKVGWSVDTNLKDAPRALVLCDSFVKEYMHKYLEQSFSYTYFVHHNSWSGFKRLTPELLAQTHPDLVMIIIAERTMPADIKLP